MHQQPRPVIIDAPMSFTGSARRIIRLAAGSGWVRALTVTAAVLLIVLAWAAILCWYLIFGLLLVPYRLIRRGQRKQRATEQRHAELMERLPPRY